MHSRIISSPKLSFCLRVNQKLFCRQELTDLTWTVLALFCLWIPDSKLLCLKSFNKVQIVNHVLLHCKLWSKVVCRRQQYPHTFMLVTDVSDDSWTMMVTSLRHWWLIWAVVGNFFNTNITVTQPQWNILENSPRVTLYVWSLLQVGEWQCLYLFWIFSRNRPRSPIYKLKGNWHNSRLAIMKLLY